MIHLTSQNFSSREIIQHVFSPLIGTISSPLADDICQKNNLNFVELLQPFSRLSTDAHFRDVSGTSVSIKGLHLNFCDIGWQPPQQNLARKMLNESVSSVQCEKTTLLPINENIKIEKPIAEIWFEQWRETFFTVQFPSDHEFTRHFLSCLVIISSSEVNSLDTANQLTKKVQMLQNVTPPKLPKWFGNDTLMCYVMLHDAATGDITKAQGGFESLKMSFGEHCCFLMQINSITENSNDFTDFWVKFLKKHQKVEVVTDQDSAPKTPQDMTSVTSMPNSVQMSSLESTPPDTLSAVSTPAESIIHPLSPVQETATDAMNPALSASCDSLIIQPMNPNVWTTDYSDLDIPHGNCLSSGDIENIKHFVQDYTIRALIPYVEKLVGQLNDSITNKKGVSRSLLSATKRWFVTNKPGVNTQQNAVVYTNESTELQIRKLGDLYFMFGNYTLAYQSYHQAKRDFNADSAWQYYAGALEMAALSAFMLGTTNKKTYDYMDEAIVTYLNSCKLPQFATRATLLSVECLKSAKLFGEAAKQLIRMTSEDSDLRSALLLEQASYCFLYSEPPLYRKYAFHSVLAGHRYSKSGQRKHAFRCYRQAYNIFENRNWSLAEDHIQYTIGKQAVSLKKLDEASKSLAHLLRPSSMQDSKQQYAFLREYIATQKAIYQNDSSDILNIALPSVVQHLTRVLVTSQPAVSKPNLIAASNISINSNLEDISKWDKLEEMIVNIASKKSFMVFKPSRSLFTNDVSSPENPLGIHGEPIEISLTIENTIKPQITFEDINLLWNFKQDDTINYSNRDHLCLHKNFAGEIDSIVSTTSINSVQINGQERKVIVIKLIPKLTGILQIIGIVGKISAANDTGLLLGKILFDKIPIKTKENQSTEFYDKRLEIIILPPAPVLQIQFTTTPIDVLAGEIIPVKMFLTNAGSEPLSDIYIATDDPRSVLINPENNELPLSILKDFRDLTNEPFSKDKEARKQHVFKLFTDNCVLYPQETKTTTIWLQAPSQKGNTEIKCLIYYAMPSGYPKLSHRLLRHVWKFNVNESIGVEANCNISNIKTNEIGFDLSIKNLNQVHHALTTEIMLSDVHLYCPIYEINNNKNIIYMKSPGYYRIFNENTGLKSNDSLSLRAQLIEKNIKETHDKLQFIKNRLSNLKIQQLDVQENVLPTFSTIGNFLIKFETKFVKDFGQLGNTEEFNNIITNLDRHMTICVTWKGLIYENSSFQRTSYGQHFVQLHNLYETISTISNDRMPQQISFASHEELFNIYDFKLKLPTQNNDQDDEWAIHNVSVARRCFLSDESETQEIGL